MIKIFCDKKEKELVNFWNHMVFHPTNSIEDDWGKEHLEKLASDKAVQIVRIYSMFEECVTQDENGNLQYDFTKNDYRIDYLLEKGFTPYIGYTFFPQFLSVEQDENLISRRYKDTIMMRSYMTDYSKWEEMCRVYTAHIVERYGEDTVASWYLHCYNEPDLKHFFYWNAPDYKTRADEYCKMYEAFCCGLRAVSPKLKIGGLALSESPDHFEFLEYFLKFVKDNNLPLDFLSYHSYGTEPETLREGTKPLHVMGSYYNTMTVKRIAKLCGFGDIPTVCDEWGACTEGYLGVDTCASFVFRENEIYAAYFAKLLTHYDEMGLTDPLLICMSGSHGLKKDFGGHRNFFTKNFYPKPIYNAFVLAAKLGSEKLYHYADLCHEDLSVMPTRHEDGHLSVLLCYADDAFTRQLKPAELEIEFAGLSGKFQVTGWRIDADHANAIRKFKELGLPQNPTEEQKAAIREYGSLKPEDLGTVSPENALFNLHVEDNTTMLLELTPVL